MCLSQQVQILQSEYPGRIQQDYVVEMKRGHFYGLHPGFRHMLAHKVDGNHPISYSELLLATRKQQRWNEARHPLLSKTTPSGESNITHSQTSVHLFPSWKLKGIQTFLPIPLLCRAMKWERTQMPSWIKRLGLTQKTQKPSVIFVEPIKQ